jgi:hypothetical protein
LKISSTGDWKKNQSRRSYFSIKFQSIFDLKNLIQDFLLPHTQRLISIGLEL